MKPLNELISAVDFRWYFKRLRDNPFPLFVWFGFLLYGSHSVSLAVSLFLCIGPLAMFIQEISIAFVQVLKQMQGSTSLTVPFWIISVETSKKCAVLTREAV